MRKFQNGKIFHNRFLVEIKMQKMNNNPEILNDFNRKPTLIDHYRSFLIFEFLFPGYLSINGSIAAEKCYCAATEPSQRMVQTGSAKAEGKTNDSATIRPHS